jgi:hypothetical protein
MIDLVPTIQRTDHHDRVDVFRIEKRVDAASQDSDAIERPCEFVMTESAAVAGGDDDRAAWDGVWCCAHAVSGGSDEL